MTENARRTRQLRDRQPVGIDTLPVSGHHVCMNKTPAATEKQIARFARTQAREAGKLRALGMHEAANELVRKCSEAVEAFRSQARAAA